jgi:chaperonin GroEL
MNDLAIATGATYITRLSGIKPSEVKLKHLGRAKSVDCIKNVTTFMGGFGSSEEIDKKIDSLTEEIKQTDYINDCQSIQERITRLASGVSIIRVGGATEIEMTERKHRIEDSLEAVRSAQAEGLVPGGGMALLMASKGLQIDAQNEEEQIGCKILLESVQAPFKKLAENCGLSPEVCLEKVKDLESNYGLNFLSNEIENLIELGVVDPTKVTRCALQNAISVAGTLLTTNHAIIQG